MQISREKYKKVLVPLLLTDNGEIHESFYIL